MTDDSLLGRMLDEYRLEQLLGQGGMARVYRGVDLRLGRYAAIKVIDTPLRGDSEYARRFEREAQAIARLEHPHIVRLYRYGETQGLLYMAMQYVEGADLGFVLSSYRNDAETIEHEDANRIIQQVCAALDYAHAQGVIHRDVKPSNIMLDKQGQVLLTDFGLALLTEVGTRGEVFGSPHYIAPEQAISSAGAVPQSDLYAVGIILYEMFTGQLPYDTDNPMDTAMLHLEGNAPPPRALRSDISPAVEQVILKAMARQPADRYPTGADLAQAFDRALHRKARGQSAAASTLSRKSISDRVAVELTAHPLPPIPAEIVPPAADTLMRPVSAPPPALPTRPTKSRPAPVLAGLAVGMMLLIAAIILLAMLFARDDGDNAPVAGNSTATQTLAVAALADRQQPTNTVVSSPTASATLPPTASLMPSPTVTLAPSVTPVPPTPWPTAEATPTAEPDYTILIATRKDDSLFLINQSDRPFPLAQLQLGEGRTALNGEAWDIDYLEPGDCVTVWKNSGHPRAPDVTCNQVGPELIRSGRERFWRSDFDVFFNERHIGRCDDDLCLFHTR